jgi:hypothetical protein
MMSRRSAVVQMLLVEQIVAYRHRPPSAECRDTPKVRFVQRRKHVRANQRNFGVGAMKLVDRALLRPSDDDKPSDRRE